MNPSSLILVTSAVGLIVNTLVLLGIAWKGGATIAELRSAVQTLTGEVSMLRTTRDQHAAILPRLVNQLDQLERRVTRLEEGA